MNNDQNEKPCVKNKPKSEFRILKFAASAVASITLVLILLGFGVSIAIEEKLGLPHSSVYESSIELLDLGSVAVIEIMPKFIQQIGEVATHIKLIAQMWNSIWVLLAIYFVGAPIALCLQFSEKAKCWANKEKTKTKQCVIKILGNNFVSMSIVFIASFVIVLISPIFVYLGIVVGLIVMSILPLTGWLAGGAYIDKMLVQGIECAPFSVLQLPQRQKEKQEPAKQPDEKSKAIYMRCLKITRDGKDFTGRVVLSTSKAAILYLPILDRAGVERGIGQRIPLSDSVVEVVDKLPDFGSKLPDSTAVMPFQPTS